jgi:hypothetical protein
LIAADFKEIQDCQRLSGFWLTCVIVRNVLAVFLNRERAASGDNDMLT